MNVMKEAHNRTKAFIAKGDCLMSYAAVLRVTLRHCHSEYKAMQKEQALALFAADTIAKFEARVVTLEAYAETPDANKWLVTCGGLPVNFEAANPSWPWATEESASKWNSPQFARVNAQKVCNGVGEYGVAVNVGEYCKAEIAKLKQMILDLTV